jgi:hypothetical protein
VCCSVVTDSMKKLNRCFINSRGTTKILIGDFNAKVGREDIFKTNIENESIHESSNNNGVRVVNFATSKTLLSKVRCFHIVTFIKLPGRLLTGGLTIKLTIYC